METKNLSQLLDTMPDGAIPNEQGHTVRDKLADAWSGFKGHENESTDSSKLHRAEELRWQRPVLYFILERHGGTVNGSSRAKLHHWEVNLDTQEAKIINKSGYRQLTPTAKRLDIKPIVNQVVKAILDQKQKTWLRWIGGSEVRVEIGKLIPKTNAQTTLDRRKRFRSQLNTALLSHDWIEKRPNCYQKRITT